MSSRYFWQKETTQRHFRDAKTEIWVMERFHGDLRELRNTVAASTESHQTQGFITLLKHFLSVLSFKCLKDLPACAVSMFPWMEDVTTANLARQKPLGKWQHWEYDSVRSSQTVIKLLLHSYTSTVRISGEKKKLTLKLAERVFWKIQPKHCPWATSAVAAIMIREILWNRTTFIGDRNAKLDLST